MSFLKKFLRSIFRLLAAFGLVHQEKPMPHEWSRNSRRHNDLINYFLSQNIPLNARIIDVGCGNGSFLRDLKARGYQNLFGCDWIDQKSSDFSYTVVDLNQDGLKHYSNQSFDCVLCSDVIEHLENPAHFLRELKRISVANGEIFLTFPNCANIFERLIFLLTGNSSRYQSELKSGPHGHISYLPTHVMQSLAARAGLRIQEIRGGHVYFYGAFFAKFGSPMWSYVITYRLKSQV